MSSVLQPLKSGLLRPQVVERLRDAIFAGDLHPGEMLRELQLAGDLKVSQATIREALLQLEQLGLVVRTPNKGTMVTKLSAAEIRDRVNIRVLLESMAATEAAQRMGRRHLDELDSLLRDFTDAIQSEAYFEAARADLAFHHYIWLQSGNPTLVRMLDQLTVPLFAFCSIQQSRFRSDLQVVGPSHELIAATLETRKPDSIQEVIRLHIQNSYHSILQEAALSDAAREEEKIAGSDNSVG